ncbi:MAG: DNA repair protein RecN [Alistipes sp.]|nr:DNA repair protein RecN [Alistipes sp.]MBO7282656.1 DNA repair protein RecN [Alistipes sp.]
MLKSLTIENYALIESLHVEWNEHLNIITGETGAGKSILLGALGMLLGAKNEGQATKDLTKNCVIEATFSIEGYNLEQVFEDNDLDYESEITIRRIITPAGKSRSFVGDMPVPLTTLKELGSHLVDIHSQHQNLILSSEDFRISTLDTLAENRATKEQYTTLLAKRNALNTKYRELEAEYSAARKDEEWLRHIVEELRAAKLKENEQAETEQKLAILESADRIGEALTALRNTLDDEELGALTTLTRSQREFESIGENYPEGANIAERLKSVLAELKDISSTASDESERIEADPEQLQRLSDRLNTIYSLEMKHRAESYDDLLAKAAEFESRLASIDNSDTELRELRERIVEAENECRKIAEELRESRKGVCKRFEEHIVTMLRQLGMEDAQFVVEITPTDTFTPTGCDSVAYLFTANRTTRPAPIERIASGGELSRVMLALKAMLVEKIKLPTVIFDEIDTGVSGRIADAMGHIISSMAEGMQVIDITHLPQVASKRGAHFVVYKSEGRTNIQRLSEKERRDEIAKMLSGSEITEAARKQAKILLG